ncbi:UDP-2,3-diacylglucosamine diphosphatase [Aestuariibacter sp. AA17]|uniref:UDP-2,3-diacylglucosamine hydrolase n=1 Tax=Fluctibacter corallii TaxID=2984329 RepID=A0ABT3ABG1_9ALTE|nr:UDP-2,3-diacylglucosamine diphosphatase [Aestuariibacter sp. AA17]MCV2885954.1 UDP-2,3-diacylglucosamine diphosphatase [Aestuariibacter sp. AA17]
MSHTLFIADLHLSADRPDITQCFVSFIRTQAIHADALYILGDLFEYWIGDDDINPFNTQVAQTIKSLSEHQVPVYFIHGNRDFLIKQAFAKRAGMTLLPEQKVIDLYGEPTVILHGDELCTMDEGYQKFRKKARGWWWPRLMLSLPLFMRRKIAENGRKESQQKQKSLAQEITDVTPKEVVTTLETHGVQRIIHGHTHRPAVHSLEANGKPAQRIVLGDWYDQGSMLVVEPGKFSLEQLPFKSR